MYPHGIIYQAGKSGSHSEYVLRPKFRVKLFYHLLRSFGFGMASFAISGILFTFWPILKEELTYLLRNNRSTIYNTGLILESSAQKTDEIKKEASDLKLNSYFSLNIDKIQARANIIPNVDAGKPGEYEKALKEGIAHAKGSNFPGQGKVIYLFSHSTDSFLNFSRYNAVFYLLGRLENEDIVTVYFLDQKYIYKVVKKVTTEPSDTYWLRDHGQGERLILQTCDPPGTSIRRLLIIAEPI